jgi:hypothetical protein
MMGPPEHLGHVRVDAVAVNPRIGIRVDLGAVIPVEALELHWWRISTTRVFPFRLLPPFRVESH